MPEKEIAIEIKKPEVIILLLILSLIFVLELRVTLNNPIVFGDEGFHASMAEYIAQEKDYPVWDPLSGNKLIKDNFARPPLWNILIASFLYSFGFNEFFIRFLPPFVTFLTGIAVFFLGKELYNEKIGFIASVITVTIPSFVTYSVLIYTDVLVTFFTTMFFLLFIRYEKKGNFVYLILTGIFGALAYLSKTSGYIVYIFVIFVFIYEIIQKRKIYEPFKKYFILFLILILIPSTFFIRNFVYYKTPSCENLPFIGKIFDMNGCSVDNFKGKYEFAGRTEQTGTEQNIFTMGIINYLTFAYGNVWFVVLAAFSGLCIISLERNKNDIFILLMLLIFLLVFQYFTSRAEDSARYSLAWAPYITLLAGIWFSDVYNFIKKYQRYVALIVFIFVIVFSYLNFKNKLSTMIQVKQFSPSFFEACTWIKGNTPKDATISTFWSSRAVFNCQRKSPGSPADLRLSTDPNYTLSVAKQFGIDYLFIQKFSIDTQNRHLSEQYDLNFVSLLENNPKYFKKVYENGSPLQQCLQQGGCDGNIVYEVNYTAS